MRPRADTPAPARGSIRDDETLLYSEAARSGAVREVSPRSDSRRASRGAIRTLAVHHRPMGEGVCRGTGRPAAQPTDGDQGSGGPAHD